MNQATAKIPQTRKNILSPKSKYKKNNNNSPEQTKFMSVHNNQAIHLEKLLND